jgi:hypothetical protein
MCSSKLRDDTNPFERIHAGPTNNLYRNLNSETIIARVLKYSVSHFIDYKPLTRRLWASLSIQAKQQNQTRE